MSSVDFDVVIVGGGPGGSAAAIGCAEAGMSVALLDAGAGSAVRPGETLHPGVEPLLERLGVAREVGAANFLRHTGHWVSWGGPRRFEPFGSDDADGAWRGFQAWRADFDAILLKRAAQNGVRVLRPVRAVAPVLAGRRVVGVTTRERTLGCRFLVDASGGRGWLARRLGLTVSTHSPRLVVRYGYAEGERAPTEDLPSLVGGARGWTWAARVRPTLYAWARLSFDGWRPPRGWLPKELCGLTARGASKSADVTWRITSPAAGPGYFLVGDAACVLDPASSHGVLRALMSGMMAAHLAAGAGETGEAQAANAYDTWLQEWFMRDAEKLREMYEIFPPARGPKVCTTPESPGASF